MASMLLPRSMGWSVMTWWYWLHFSPCTVASAVPSLSAEGHERMARAMAATRMELEPLNFAEEVAKRDQLLALA